MTDIIVVADEFTSVALCQGSELAGWLEPRATC